MIYVDRSRYKTFFSCPFERYLCYHYLGTGIVKPGSEIPLATGTHTHNAIEGILNLAVVQGDLPRANDVRQIIDDNLNAYRTQVSEAGFVGLGADERAEFVLEEQATLISGLVWAWSIHILPRFLESYKILHVEQEMERVVGCDCGLSGIGVVEHHVARSCGGVTVMTRPDIIARKLSTNELVYIELKTGSKIDSTTFEGDVQFAFGAVGVESYVGEPLVESYVHALSKGYRKNEYNPATRKYDLPPKQASSLCYAYVREGVTGMIPPDIKFRYGKGVTKQHKKTPVWEIAFRDAPSGIPPIEHYISTMPDEELESHVDIFGPFPYPKLQIEDTLADIFHTEKRNAEVFLYVDALVQEHGLANAGVQNAIHEFIPKSWNCRKYGRICSYYPICAKRNGWEDPTKFLGFIPRSPNHPIEFEV